MDVGRGGAAAVSPFRRREVLNHNRGVKIKMPVLAAACLILLSSAAGRPAEPPADLVLTGGRVWTAEAATPWADAVAIRDGRIVYVGDASGAARLRGPKTQLVELRGRLVVPGFDDAHIHMMSGALSLDRVDLIEDQTVQAVQARIRAFAAAHPASGWILGRGWLYGSFPGGLPTKEQLDAAVPDRPAYMECYDGHSGWANSKALARAGITKDTKDPVGGSIVRDPVTGEPTGALKEAATALIESRILRPIAEARYGLLLRALAQLNAQGITSVQDAGYTPGEIDAELPVLERALREGKLTVRMTVSVQMSPGKVTEPVSSAAALAKTHRGPLLRFGAVKGFVDGVIEAHTAAMLEPYSDDPSFGTGKPNWEPAALNAAVVAADKAGLQVYLHAIGDRGVRMALDAHEAALRANGRTDRRGRIEHIETISPDDYPRFKALGVIASMQPLHANPDQNNADVWSRNIGPERASRGFSWRNIEKAGGRLVFGSDWPVVTSDVMRGLYCAVTRKTKDGTPPGGWLPEQAVGLESALRHYTIDGAYASFEESEKGSIASGKRADLVVLSEDLFRRPPEAILKTRVLLTVMDGRVVHRAAELPAP
jgi:predicted amidohydrolase YtcJ